MSAATSVTATSTTTQVQITDPSLLAFHTLHKSVFDETQKGFDTFYPQWEIKQEELENYAVGVKRRQLDLQQGTTKVPAEPEFLKERVELVGQYWEYKGTCDKMSAFGANIQKSISFLTPQPRTWADEKRLADEQPELLEQMKRDDEICREYVTKLGEAMSKVTTLNAKMTTLITTRVDLPLCRFCQIVDKKGQPLDLVTREWYKYIQTPVVPKLQAVEIKQVEEFVTVAKDASKDTASTESSATPASLSAPTLNSPEASATPSATAETKNLEPIPMQESPIVPVNSAAKTGTLPSFIQQTQPSDAAPGFGRGNARQRKV